MTFFIDIFMEWCNWKGGLKVYQIFKKICMDISPRGITIMYFFAEFQ